MVTTWLKPTRMVLADRILTGAALGVAQGRIVALRPEAEVPADAQVLPLEGTLTPGLMDSHVHGALEHDVMDATDEALGAISAHLARHGVTSWWPTTVACDPARLEQVLTVVAAAREREPGGARIRRAHLESNFLSPRYKGAQPEQWLRPASDPTLREVLERHRDSIGLVTLAPEVEGALELIGWLRARAVRVSLGHTDATYDQVMAAVEAGATRMTHLCNAQRGFHHREPGALGAGLACDELTCEVIADGLHVHPAGLTIAVRCKGSDRLVLVSDALRGSGLAPGTYELGGQTTRLDGRIARLEDGTIAGSVITLDRALARMITEIDVPVVEAVRMASLTVAQSLDLATTGQIAVGMEADLALFDDGWTCRRTWVAGRAVHGEDAP